MQSTYSISIPPSRRNAFMNSIARFLLRHLSKGSSRREANHNNNTNNKYDSNDNDCKVAASSSSHVTTRRNHVIVETQKSRKQGKIRIVFIAIVFIAVFETISLINTRGFSRASFLLDFESLRFASASGGDALLLERPPEQKPTEPPLPPVPEECKGKERFWRILEDAGIGDNATVRCPLLATWSSYADVYGEEPIVIGMESCGAYRSMLRNAEKEQGIPYEPRPRLAGSFNTGTNAMKHFMNLNLGYRGPHHQYEVPWGKHVPLAFAHNNTFPWNNTQGRYRDLVLPIVMIKDPLTWMNSMCRAGYHISGDRCHLLGYPGHSRMKPNYPPKYPHQRVPLYMHGVPPNNLQRQMPPRYVTRAQQQNPLMPPRPQHYTRHFANREMKLSTTTSSLQQSGVSTTLATAHPAAAAYISGMESQRLQSRRLEAVQTQPLPPQQQQQRQRQQQLRKRPPRPLPLQPHTHPQRRPEDLQPNPVYFHMIDITDGDVWKQYKSLLHLWNSFYRDYWDTKRPRLIIRYEDLIMHAPAILKAIRECIGEDDDDSGPTKYVLQAAKAHGTKSQSFFSSLQKYSQTNLRLQRLPLLDLNYASHVLDEELMNAFHYPLPPKADPETKKKHKFFV